MSITFVDNSVEVKAALKQAGIAWLNEAGGELESQVKRNTAVDKGQLKNSWDYKVNESSMTCTVGSSLENALWEEFGTGEYALNNDGRKTPWYVPVEGYTGHKKPTFRGKVTIVHGRNGKDYYKTDGKKPRRALHKAFESKKKALQAAYENKLKGVLR